MRSAHLRASRAGLAVGVGALAIYFVAISAALAYTAGGFVSTDSNRVFGVFVAAFVLATWVLIAFGLRTRMRRRLPVVGVLQNLVVWLLLADVVMLAVAVVSTGVI